MSCREKCLAELETFNSELKVDLQNILFKTSYLFLEEVSYMFRLKVAIIRLAIKTRRENYSCVDLRSRTLHCNVALNVTKIYAAS
jgi:hypothetical protein